MLTTVLVAIYAAAVVTQTFQPPVRELIVASSAISIVAVAPDRADAIEHIANARRAASLGQFDVARREYVIAVAIDRDAGLLPAEATHGLVQVLYAQSYNREAARALGVLASEAEMKGATDVEARALLDAIWLNLDAGQRNVARSQAQRLQLLLKDRHLSAETVALVRTRYK